MTSPDTTTEQEVTYLATLQLNWGGLFDSKPHDNLAHLVRGTRRGTPGPTLCGIDRFAKDGPGFSVGGGVTPHGVIFDACPGCVETALREFPGVPVAGMESMSTRLAEALGVPAHRHNMDVPLPPAEASDDDPPWRRRHIESRLLIEVEGQPPLVSRRCGTTAARTAFPGARFTEVAGYETGRGFVIVGRSEDEEATA